MRRAIQNSVEIVDELTAPYIRMAGREKWNGDADEEDFLAIVVANETVLRWKEKWISYDAEGDVGEVKLAVLLREVARVLSDGGEAYASEALACGLAERAVATMKRVQDSPNMMEDLSAIIVACSGPSAQGDKVKTLSFGPLDEDHPDHHKIVIKEGALSDGVGAKLWRVARIMCERMIRDKKMVEGKTVLEVGAGVGACGFLAGKLGSKSVVISDYVDTLLLNLRDALALNMPDEESADDGWTRAKTAIRFIDWEDSINRSGDGESNVAGPPPAALDGESSRTLAPSVDGGVLFETIIGTDVLYEWPMVDSLSSCIKQRLAPGGAAYICNAVRDQEMFDALVECIRSKDLLVKVDGLDVTSTSEDGWCQEDSYEGGFVFVTISHQKL